MSDVVDNILSEDSLKFCPTCGHEGNDEICPVCNDKMASLDEEVDKLAEKEKEEDKDITDTSEVSLEEVAEEEGKDEN